MDQVAEYVLLATTSHDELVEMVNQKLRKGWRLYGGPCVRGAEIFQAMVMGEAEAVVGEQRARKTSEE